MTKQRDKMQYKESILIYGMYLTTAGNFNKLWERCECS